MGFLEILSPGSLTSVQDLGRPGSEHLGISPSGAADPLSLRFGNRVLGNSESAPALEMTLTGARLRFECDAVISVSGAEMGARLDEKPVERLRSVFVRRGQTFSAGTVMQGCRSYLCVKGGLQIPLVLGSASTHLQSGIGGFHGRAVKKGDRLEIQPSPESKSVCLPVEKVDSAIFKKTLRVTTSIHTELFGKGAWQEFLKRKYTVTPQSNRLGLRLDGAPIDHVPEILTTGVCLGNVQISADGKPTLLFVEQQLTGGYPLLGCVITADLPAIGQLKPGDEIRFEEVSFREAITAVKALRKLERSE